MIDRAVPALTRALVLADLATAVERLAERQLTRPGEREDGAPWAGYDDPSHSGAAPLVAGALLLAAAGHDRAPALLAAAERAIGYLLRVQRPSGRIDLKDCNYDSDPDTAFVVQLLCAALEVAAPAAQRDPALAALVGTVRGFTRAAALGLRDGGFHTPNHRWVVSSAIVMALRHFPDLPLAETLEALLAEGPDVDDEGCFIERSPAIYDAVTVRSLLLVHRHRPWPEGVAAALANLRFDRTLLNADGTIETGLSHRQDLGTRVVPDNLVHAWLLAAKLVGDPSLADGAAWLWIRAGAHLAGTAFWTAWVVTVFGEPPVDQRPPTADLNIYHPRNRLWRLRHGDFSASVFGSGTRLLGVRWGGVELVGVSVAFTWFGHGNFVPAEAAFDGSTCTLTARGRIPGRRLGYSQALGRPVPAAEWDAAMAERPLRPMPDAVATLAVTADGAAGLDLRLQADFCDGVLGQIALDFPPGGTWECAGGAWQPQAGQVIFLSAGHGTMRFGNDAITIGPGQEAHRIWHMRDVAEAPRLVRVVIPLRTPVDHAFAIRCTRGW